MVNEPSGIRALVSVHSRGAVVSGPVQPFLDVTPCHASRVLYMPTMLQ